MKITLKQDGRLSSTMEDYLEAVYSLKKQYGCARVSQLARQLDVKSPTVNAAVKFLSDKGLVTHKKYGFVDLTKKGERSALKVQNKHDILFRFLTEFLMLDHSTAQEEACRIEHAISQQTFVRLNKFFKFLEQGFNGQKPKFIENFERYISTGRKIKCDCGKGKMKGKTLR